MAVAVRAMEAAAMAVAVMGWVTVAMGGRLLQRVGADSVTEVADLVTEVADSVTEVADSVTEVADSVTEVAERAMAIGVVVVMEVALLR